MCVFSLLLKLIEKLSYNNIVMIKTKIFDILKRWYENISEKKAKPE